MREAKTTWRRLTTWPGIRLEGFATWYERWRQRRTLEGLDERLLRDIGVSRDQALRESDKPFWMA